MRRCFALAVYFVSIPFVSAQPSKIPLRIDDLYRFDAPTQATLAPDGRSVVYVRQWIDAKSKKDRFALWRVEGDVTKSQPMEPGEPDARSPDFSPDGKWIAFLSTRPHPDGWRPIPPTPPQSDAATDLWLIPSSGGVAIPLGGPEKPWGRVFNDGFYGHVAFSPDGKRLAFVADDGKDPRTQQEIDADVVVVPPDQGEGYTGYRPAQIWVATLDETPTKSAARQVRRLTKDEHWYGDPQWSPDGKFLVVHANRTAEQESVRYSINRNFDLWAIDIDSREIKQLTTSPGPDVSPRFIDKNRLVFLTNPRRGSHRDMFNLAILTLDASGPKTQVLFDHHGPGADKPPHPPAYFPLPRDLVSGSTIYFNTESGVHGGLMKVDLETGVARVGVPLDVKKGISSPAARIRRRSYLTPVGNAMFPDRLQSETTVIRWENEGLRLEGVFHPPTNGMKPPYKLVIFPHGGPHGRAVLGYNFTAEIFAAHGYAVFQPNFRGSSGYGQKFIDADRGDFGGGDMRDILSGIDHLVKQGHVDAKQQYVFGISYGGFMTSWLVGHTTQFRAAVMQNAVTDLNAMWGLSDLQSWTEWEFGGRPWEVPDAMRKHSPLTYAGNVKTPTLVLHSRDDRRCPLPMGLMFHQALRARGVPTEMVIYPDEGHGIRQPRHREDVLRRTLAWFAAHEK
jgi:dipeptidyl aminopeptidase/acylaminoacyl peptidase